MKTETCFVDVLQHKGNFQNRTHWVLFERVVAILELPVWQVPLAASLTEEVRSPPHLVKLSSRRSSLHYDALQLRFGSPETHAFFSIPLANSRAESTVFSATKVDCFVAVWLLKFTRGSEASLRPHFDPQGS